MPDSAAAPSRAVAQAGAPEAGTLVDAVIELGRLALAFGRINRTACYHPDGDMRESDADHTVMLGWLGPALADRWFPSLDGGLVAQFALVHDMVEVYCGDTPTLRIDAAGREAKAERERAAARRLVAEFGKTLPWVPATVLLYEEQVEPEARFVRALDKCLPKIVHLLDGARGLREEGMTSTELTAVFERQRVDMTAYAGEFTDLMELREELVARTVALVAAQEENRAR
jgi:putative hydrolases of HD superfamily